jgi:hypothetical protein
MFDAISLAAVTGYGTARKARMTAKASLPAAMINST